MQDNILYNYFLIFNRVRDSLHASCSNEHTLCFDIDFMIQRDLQTLFTVTELHGHKEFVP